MNDVANVLDQLRDIHPPGAPGLWPPAPGWWVLGFAVLAISTWTTWRLWQRHRRAAWRRGVVTSLDALESAPQAQASPLWLVAELSVLLKRVALRAHGGRDVASLSGQGWLAFLDQTGGDGQFSQGPGRVLEVGPYARHEQFDSQELMDLCRRWMQQNLRGIETAGR